MITATQLPPDVHTAYNPIILKVETDRTELSVSIKNEDGSEVSILTKEIMNNKATFDLSSIIKSMFKDEVWYNGNIDGEIIQYHKILFVPYSFNIVPIADEFQIPANDLQYRLALNAVAQIRQTSDLSAWQGKFLTTARTLKKYEGYPLEIAFLNYSNREAIVYFNQQPIAPENEPLTEPHFVISIPDGISTVHVSDEILIDYLETNANEHITTNAGEPIVIHIYPAETLGIDSPCGYGSPFYVRWINRIGGYDYFMFDFRYTHSKEVKSIKTYSPNYDNQADIPTFDIPIEAQAEEVVTAGADGLENDEYERVSNLVYSPKIEWYDKANGVWVRLQVDKSKLEKNSRQRSQSVEFEFLLPKIQLQY